MFGIVFRLQKVNCAANFEDARLDVHSLNFQGKLLLPANHNHILIDDVLFYDGVC